MQLKIGVVFRKPRVPRPRPLALPIRAGELELRWTKFKRLGVGPYPITINRLSNAPVLDDRQKNKKQQKNQAEKPFGRP